MRVTREKLIMIGIYFLIFLSIIQLLNGHYSKASEYTKIYTFEMTEIPMLLQIQSAIYLFIILVSIVSIITCNKLMLTIYGIFLGSILLWSSYELITGITIQSYLLSGTSPFIYLSSVCILIGQRYKMWQLIVKHSVKLAIICSIMIIFFAITAISKYHMVTGRAPFLIMLTYNFWFVAVTVFCNQTRSLIKWILMILCVIISILYGSRGWLLISLLMMVMFYFGGFQGKRQKKIKILYLIIILLMIFYFGNYFFPDHFRYFLNRIGESTRLQQYKILFNSISIRTVLLGGGMNITYSFNGSKSYQYFDNVFIFNLFHYGIIMACSYYLLILVPLIIMFKKRKTLTIIDKGLCCIFILWFLSINGFSVYNGITYDAKNIFIMLILGRLLKVISIKNRKKYVRRKYV